MKPSLAIATHEQERDERVAREANERGLTLANAGDWHAAEEAFREALRADAGFASAHNNLGLVLMQRGELYEAAVAFRAASKLSPRAAAPLVNLGRLYESIGWDQAAADQYKSAMKIDSHDLAVAACLAQLYAKMGKNDSETRNLLDTLAGQAEEPWRSWAVAQQTARSAGTTGGIDSPR